MCIKTWIDSDEEKQGYNPFLNLFEVRSSGFLLKKQANKLLKWWNTSAVSSVPLVIKLWILHYPRSTIQTSFPDSSSSGTAVSVFPKVPLLPDNLQLRWRHTSGSHSNICMRINTRCTICFIPCKWNILWVWVMDGMSSTHRFVKSKTWWEGPPDMKCLASSRNDCRLCVLTSRWSVGFRCHPALGDSSPCFLQDWAGSLRNL